MTMECIKNQYSQVNNKETYPKYSTPNNIFIKNKKRSSENY